jgi:hypothetical protein
MEYCVVPPAAPGPGGLPSFQVSCRRNDPACDAQLGDSACQFQIALCFNMDDPRFPCVTDKTISEVRVYRPTDRGGIVDIENRLRIEAALTQIGGKVVGKCQTRGKLGLPCAMDSDCESQPGAGDGRCRQRAVKFDPPLTASNVCTPLFQVSVPLRTSSVGGQRVLRVWAFKPNRKKKIDGDHLYLSCRP